MLRDNSRTLTTLFLHLGGFRDKERIYQNGSNSQTNEQSVHHTVFIAKFIFFKPTPINISILPSCKLSLFPSGNVFGVYQLHWIGKTLQTPMGRQTQTNSSYTLVYQ